MRGAIRILARAALAVAGLALLGILGAWLLARSSLPRLDGTARLEGLGAPVSVRRDERGVPHIDAASEADAAAAVGFVHAQDRMFQMDLIRRSAAGRLSEIVGAAALELDRRSRKLGLLEAARAQLAWLSAEETALLAAYARGVNAGLALTGRPVEAWLLRYRPEPWSPLDTLLVLKHMEDLLAFDGEERDRARLGEKLGADLAALLMDFEGMEGATILPPGHDGPQAAPPVAAGPGSPCPGAPSSAPPADPDVPVPGSNAWVVSGRRTRSGKPILANDTHLPASAPSIYYEVHLRYPGVDVAGMTIPGEPLPVLGHNGKVAWGVTTLMADQVDWVRLELDPSGERFRGPLGLEDLTLRREAIRIQGGGEEALTVKLSRFGPIVEEEAGTGWARDWTVYHHSRTLRAIRGFARAGDAEEFRRAAVDFTSPGQNLVFADIAGRIGYVPAGSIPLRRVGDGRLPLPGSEPCAGMDEMVPESDAPWLLDPERGFIVTANNQIGAGPRALRIASSWALPWRADRIQERIEERLDHDLASMEEIQGDVRSALARAVIPALPASVPDPRAQRWLARLQAWDQRYERGEEPAFFELFWRELRRATFEDEAGSEWPEGELGLLKALGARRFAGRPQAAAKAYFDDRRNMDRVEDLAAIVERALLAAEAELERLLGKDPEQRDWARIHTVTFPHPLGRLPLLGRLFDIGPFAVRGGAQTVCVTAGRAASRFRVSFVPTVRMLVDLADPSRSRIVNPTGQSGHFLSPHYSDQSAAWARVESYPMRTAEADVAAHTRHTLRLEP